MNYSSFLQRTVSYMIQTEHRTEHKSHTSPIRNTPEKLSSVLNNRTIRKITHLLDPYKRNFSDTLIITHTHTIHCYDKTHKLLQSLDFSSQRITQLSQAIQTALESITTLFNSTNLQKNSTEVKQFSLFFIPLVHYGTSKF